MSLPDWMTDRPIAHRGFHRPGPACPENSLAALHAAWEAGYAAEIDVQLSADGEVMVFHDRRLERLTGMRGRTADRTAAALGRLRLARGGECIPTLAAAMRELPDLPLLIELKMEDMATPSVARSRASESRTSGSRPGGSRTALAAALARVLDACPAAPVAIQSFDPELVGWFADNRPDLPRGLIAYQRRNFGHRSVEQPYRAEAMAVARPTFLAWHVKSLPVAASIRGDLPVMTWTVRSQRDLIVATRHADNIIFEGFRA